jgi:hypothetical protein
MSHQGRNERCRCGSGKKFKRCHGSSDYQQEVQEAMTAALRQSQAAEVQRQRQQGLGKPIISTEIAGQRVIAVRNRIFYSSQFKTFTTS